MSKVSPDKLFDRAIDLVINQDRVIYNWTGRYITIQGALAVAVATLLAWQGPKFTDAVKVGVVLLSILGLASSWIITEILKREYFWQSEFVQAARRAETDTPIIFTEEKNPGPGTIAKYFISLRWFVFASWIVFLVWFILSTVGVLPT